MIKRRFFPSPPQIPIAKKNIQPCRPRRRHHAWEVRKFLWRGDLPAKSKWCGSFGSPV